MAVYRGCGNHDLVLYPLRGIGAWLGRALDTASQASVAWRACTRISDGSEAGWLTGLWAPSGDGGAPAAPEPVAEVAVAVAEEQLVIDVPDVATSPPRGGVQLVGVAVWFWVENFEAVSTTAEIPGLSATLVASPVASRFAFSNGESISCAGGGVAYDPDRSPESQSSDCAWEFVDDETVTVDASVDWELTWTATNGQSGTLPVVTRTSSFTLTIHQAQATTD